MDAASIPWTELCRYVPAWALVAWFGFFGASLGSFINVIVVRWPRGESIVRPRSKCPGCARPIAWYDNLPLLSFALLRGRCRGCGMRIGYRYVLIEALLALLSVGLWARFGCSWPLLLWWPLCAILVAITFLDLDHFWVPDRLTFPAMGFAGVMSLAPGGIGGVQALLGLVPAAFAWAVAWGFERLRGKEGLALGDVKLLAVIGLALGPWLGLTVLLWASIQGALVGSLVSLTGGHRRLWGPRDAPVEPPAAPTTTTPEPEATGTTDASPKADDDEPEWQPPPGAFPFGPLLVLATFEVVFLPEWFAALLPNLNGLLQGLP